MTQVLFDSDPFAVPSWMQNVGTTGRIPQFSTQYVPVLPFSNLGGGGTFPTMTNGVGFISGALSFTQGINGAFNKTQDGTGLGADQQLRAWLALDARGTEFDALELKFVFRIDGVGGGALPENQAVKNVAPLDPVSGGTGRFGNLATGGAPIASSVGEFTAQGHTASGAIKAGTINSGYVGTLIGFRLRGSHVAMGGSETSYGGGNMTFVDGYWLWIDTTAPTIDGDLTLRLYRLIYTSQTGTGGTATLVATQTVPNGMVGLNFGKPFRIRVTIDNVAGDPEMQLFLSEWNDPSQPTGTEQALFSSASLIGQFGGAITPGASISIAADGTITDSSATRITGQGTIGFGGACDRIMSVPEEANDLYVSEGLIALEATSGSSKWRDEFGRIGSTATSGSLNTSEFLSPTEWLLDIHGNMGPAVEAYWAWGLNANTGSVFGDIDPLLQRTEVGGTAFDPAAHALLGYESGVPPGVGILNNTARDFYSMRPSTFNSAHHRSIIVTPGAQNNAEPNYVAMAFKFGVALRVNPLASTLFGASISCRLVMTTDASTGAQTSLSCQIIRRTRLSPDSVPIIRLIVSADLQGVVDLLDGSPHTLDFDCHDHPAGSGVDIPAIYHVQVDAVDVVFIVDPGVDWNVQVLANNDVIDTEPFTVFGNGEGFYFESQSPQTDAGANTLWESWQVTDWVEEAATVPPGGIGPDDMASIVVAGEGTPTGELFDSIQNNFPFTIEFHEQALMQRFESGHVASMPRIDRLRRKYNFHSSGTLRTELDALLVFWSDHDGIESPFFWTVDGEPTVTAYFERDSLAYNEIGPDAFAVRFVVEELLA